MGLRSVFSKKTPEERVSKKMLQIEIGDKAINLVEVLPNENETLVMQVANVLITDGKLKGILVGQQGWFLPDGNKKIDEIWSQLKSTHINLENVSNRWGLNPKRTYIALNDFAQTKNIADPVFIRKNNKLYFTPYLKQVWIDTISGFDLDDEITIDKIIENSGLESDSKIVLANYMEKELKEKNSEIILGKDKILRSRSELHVILADNIAKRWEEGFDQVEFSTLAENYGVTKEDIRKTLQELIETKRIKNITIYPLEEVIKPRS